MSDVYDWTDDFDKAITNLSHVPNKPAFIIDAAVEVHDTLKLANTSAKAIFGKDVSPEIAVKIYDRLEANRVFRVNEFAKQAEFWMQSDVAAIDKANELDIKILPEYSMADLRYKIHCAMTEVNNGG
ncbi:MAG: hypothetical protein V9E92_09630 [Methylotenera sp.]